MFIIIYFRALQYVIVSSHHLSYIVRMFENVASNVFWPHSMEKTIMFFYICFAFGPPRSLALASCGLMLPSGTATTPHPPPTTFLHIILSLKCPCFFSSNESQQKRSIMKRLESGLRVSSSFLYKI